MRQTLVLLSAHDPALMRDCLDVVLVLVTRLVQSMLSVLQLLAELGLLRMVEPLHPDDHAAGPGLPEALDATYIREVGASS